MLLGPFGGSRGAGSSGRVRAPLLAGPRAAVAGIPTPGPRGPTAGKAGNPGAIGQSWQQAAVEGFSSLAVPELATEGRPPLSVETGKIAARVARGAGSAKQSADATFFFRAGLGTSGYLIWEMDAHAWQRNEEGRRGFSVIEFDPRMFPFQDVLDGNTNTF